MAFGGCERAWIPLFPGYEDRDGKTVAAVLVDRGMPTALSHRILPWFGFPDDVATAGSRTSIPPTLACDHDADFGPGFGRFAPLSSWIVDLSALDFPQQPEAGAACNSDLSSIARIGLDRIFKGASRYRREAPGCGHRRLAQ